MGEVKLYYFVNHELYLPSTEGETKMAEKKVTAVVKLQLQAGKATAGPPVGSSLGPHGINIPAFVKDFNEKTADKVGLVIPIVMKIYHDRSFTFTMKTPPAAVLIKKAIGIESGSAKPNKDKVGKISKQKVKEIATMKMKDLNANTIDSAISMVMGTARSMGITIED